MGSRGGGGCRASGEALLGKRECRGKDRDYAECRDYGLSNITIETAHSTETVDMIDNMNDNIHVTESSKTSNIRRIRMDKSNVIVACRSSNNVLDRSINPQGGGIPNKTPNAPKKKFTRISAKQLKSMTKNSLQAIRTVQDSKIRTQQDHVTNSESTNNIGITSRIQVTIATNRFENQPNVISREGYGLMRPEVEHIRDNPTEYIFANQLQALFRLFAMNSEHRIAVVSTIYIGHMLLRHFLLFRDYNPLNVDFNATNVHKYSFDDNRDLEYEISTVIIPVVLNGHFAAAIWDKDDSIIHYFDSLNWTLNDDVRQALIHAVRSLTGRVTNVRISYK